MAKGVSKELDREIRLFLGKMIDMEPGSNAIPLPRGKAIANEAIKYLTDLGVLELLPGNSRFHIPATVRVTAYGREYYERLTTFAPWYWFKQNWFGAIVALATVAASVGGIVANVLNKPA